MECFDGDNEKVLCQLFLFFFFKQKTAYEMRISDWSSDVCSSDLIFSENVAIAMMRALSWTLCKIGSTPSPRRRAKMAGAMQKGSSTGLIPTGCAAIWNPLASAIRPRKKQTGRAHV